MAKKIVATDSPARRIRDVGSAAPCIDPALVAAALGAEDMGITLGREGSPVASFQLATSKPTVAVNMLDDEVDAGRHQEEGGHGGRVEEE